MYPIDSLVRLYVYVYGCVSVDNAIAAFKLEEDRHIHKFQMCHSTARSKLSISICIYLYIYYFGTVLLLKHCVDSVGLRATVLECILSIMDS